MVDQAIVTDAQNCGSVPSGVGPFAMERGLVPADGGRTRVAIFMTNSGQTAIATVETPGGRVTYASSARIDGVPGTTAPVPLEFMDTVGSTCGALLATGRALDVVDGIEVAMIDNGMPCVVMRACRHWFQRHREPRGARRQRDADGEPRARSPRMRAADEPGSRPAIASSSPTPAPA